MKVKDAKEKWCPKAMAWDGSQEVPMVANRDDFGMPSSRCLCLADTCACWVWDKKTGETTIVNIVPDDWQGHCGLAR